MARQARDAVLNMRDDDPNRANMWCRVAQQLEGREKRELLERVIQTEREKVENARIVPSLQTVAAVGREFPDLLDKVRSLAETLDDDEKRVDLLSLVAIMLPIDAKRDLFRQVLSLAESMDDDSASYSEALADIVTNITGDTDLAQPLKAALSLDRNQSERISIPAALATHNPTLLTYDVWSDCLIHSELQRREIFEVMDDIMRGAVQLAGRKEEAVAIVDAMHEICEWWP